MCQQIIQFCNGSTKPLLFAGSFLLMLLAIAIGYTGCTTFALYNDIDPTIAATTTLGYFLQLAATGYLTLITIISCFAAYYDHKQTIRVLAFVTSLNFALALVAVLMVPSGQELGQQFEVTLKQAIEKYQFSVPSLDKAEIRVNVSENGTIKEYRWIKDETSNNSTAIRELSPQNATELWDKLQTRGCCGIRNATAEWPPNMVPKSCCDNPVTKDSKMLCEKIDAAHNVGCLNIISRTSSNLLIVLSLIALVNFYLALVTSISAYRTFHYDEASQNVYT